MRSAQGSIVEQFAPNVVPRSNCFSDEQIVIRVLGGQTELFEVIVRRHNRKLFQLANCIVRNYSDAEDVVQDTFFSAYQHLAQFAGRANFGTWLSRIALYRALSKVGSRRREVPLEEDDQGVHLPRLVHRGSSPEQTLCANETAEVLNNAIQALPENYRRVLLMRCIDEFDTATTARELGTTETNVKVRLHRARTMLRRESAPGLLI
jgi:RNA polymerase sigma-70 factor (ECF subfamily)